MNLRLAVSLALSGLPLGAMYSLQAMGIVLVYRTSRVFNFAQGAIGMTAAYLGSFVGVSLGLPAILSVLLATAGGAAVGLSMELLTIRPMRGALARTVVTLGWLIGLQGLVGVLFGAEAGRLPVRLFPSTTAVRIDSLAVAFGADQLGITVLALGLAVGLARYLRRSAFGTAMRAVADNVEGAELLGIRARTVSAVSWAIGAGLAGLAGVLVTPLLGTLDTQGLVILTIQALAAALIGGLSSLPLTFVGGLALGALQPVAANWLGGRPGVNEFVAFVVVLVALLFRRRAGRSDVSEGALRPARLRALPTGATARAAVVGVLVAATVIPLLGGAQWNYNVANTAAWSLAVLSIVLLVGVVGQVSLCQAVFMAIGAFTGGIASAHGTPFLLAILVGGLAAAAAAALVAIPAIRLRPLELAIVTMSLAFTADRFLYRWTPLVGDRSVRELSRPGFANEVVHGVAGARAYSWLAIGVFLAAALGVANLRRGRTGAALTALRGSEAAASAMGFSPAALRLRGFALSGFLAGVAGVVFAGLTGAASSTPFDTTRSITLLAYAVIAGAGSVPGAVLGGLIVTVSTLSFGGNGVASGLSGSMVTLLTGGVLIVVMLVAPTGLAGLAQDLRERWRSARSEHSHLAKTGTAP